MNNTYDCNQLLAYFKIFGGGGGVVHIMSAFAHNTLHLFTQSCISSRLLEPDSVGQLSIASKVIQRVFFVWQGLV